MTRKSAKLRKITKPIDTGGHLVMGYMDKYAKNRLIDMIYDDFEKERDELLRTISTLESVIKFNNRED